MPRVENFHWNPRSKWTPSIRGHRLRYGPRINNFGDLLGPVVVDGMLRMRGIDATRAIRRTQLLSVGSVVHLAKSGATVWGSGVNGKMGEHYHRYRHLDVRAVRGPLTRDYLLAKGIDVPQVYGDPALLLPMIMPGLKRAEASIDVLVLPNLNDAPRWSGLAWAGAAGSGVRLVDPRSPLPEVLGAISRSRLVVGSSLHGIVVAEALGIPARLVVPGSESTFKYEDYYRGTGRAGYTAAATPEEAVAMGGEQPLDFDPAPLLDAFPIDLWHAARSAGVRAFT